jgi:hypothetical protein
VNFYGHKRRSSDEINEEKRHFEYFVQSTFGSPANFASELRNLFAENCGRLLKEKACEFVQPSFRGKNFRAAIMSALAEAWNVPMPKVYARYRELSEVERQTIDAVVDQVVEEEFGAEVLARARAAIVPTPRRKPRPS